MSAAAPRATVRARVPVPIALPDGSTVLGHLTTFDGLVDGREHVAVELGEPVHGPPLVRLHSECLTGDVLGSERCDCGPQLAEGLARIAAAGGVLLYLRQEGRGIGLYAKLDAYLLQDTGLDTYDANVALGFGADERDYTVAAQMLVALGRTSVRLLTNNPDKAEQLARLGIDVVARVPTGVHRREANVRYLQAKVRRAAHTIEVAG
ncbi:GTP cyclohydrolase II [Mumia sp. DW29H23]|uniref:GTP cyclohydrolase II n=1 Tax=Mumia sp. DW29H23 TaxID=3421241 RepID=UPI003D681B52